MTESDQAKVKQIRDTVEEIIRLVKRSPEDQDYACKKLSSLKLDLVLRDFQAKQEEL